MQVAARELLTSTWRPTMPTAADYVQDGLIAMWDGIENIGWNTHSDTATTWVDLVNGANLTVKTGGTWGPAYLQTSGSACGATSNATKVMNLYDSVKHYQCCFKFDVAYTNGRILVELRNGSKADTPKLALGQTVLTGSKYYVYINKCFGVTRDTLRHSAACTFTNRNTVTTIWYDGVVKTPTNNSGTGAFGSSLSIGSSANTAASCCQGKVFCLRFYNRNLTDYEVLANTSVDRRRFGRY